MNNLPPITAETRTRFEGLSEKQLKQYINYMHGSTGIKGEYLQLAKDILEDKKQQKILFV